MRADAIFPNFSSEGFEWFGDSLYCATTLDRTETSPGQRLSGALVVVNGALWRCRRVEIFCHAPPFHVGEKIGLALDPAVEITQSPRLFR